MKRSLVWVVVVCSACAYPDPDPHASARSMVTPCGLSLENGTEDEFAALVRQERITLNALSSVTTNEAWTYDVTCPQLTGATVQVAPLADGGVWHDDLFFDLCDDFDRGSYVQPKAVRVTTDEWPNPEFSFQLARIITAGKGSPDDVLFITAQALADAAAEGRKQPGPVVP